MNNFVQTYTEKVSLGELTEDPAQTAVLPEFDRIQKALSVPVKRSWFSKPLPPPKGLYLWGGVGRGKSMMMDLFVDSLGLPCRFTQGAQKWGRRCAGSGCRGCCHRYKVVGV